MSNHSSEEEEREALAIKCGWAPDKCHGMKRAMSGRQKVKTQKRPSKDSPGDPVVKNLPANAGDMGSIPGPGREVPNQWLTILRKKHVRGLYETEEKEFNIRQKHISA